MPHAKFRGNQRAGSGEEDLFRVFSIYGRAGHVTSIMSSDLHFLVTENFYKKLVQIDTVVSEKIWFEFLYVQDLGPRSSNYLDLQILTYLHIFN